MKSIKCEIDHHINDCIVASCNKMDTFFLDKKRKEINILRAKKEFGHFLNQGFIETAKQYFDKF